jgi:hypothetical protein
MNRETIIEIVPLMISTKGLKFSKFDKTTHEKMKAKAKNRKTLEWVRELQKK